MLMNSPKFAGTEFSEVRGSKLHPHGSERSTTPRILTHMHGAFVSGTSDGDPYATRNEYEFGQ